MNDDTFTPTERFNCPICEGAIDRSSVLIRKLNGGRYEPARQEVHIHCEHCNCIAELRRRKNGGIWQLDSGVTAITSEKARAVILDRLERQRTALQMEAA